MRNFLKPFGVFATVVTLILLIPAISKAVSSGATYARLPFATTNVTTTAYVQLFAQTQKGISAVSAFNSGSAPIKLAFGAAGSEVDQIVIPPNSSSGATGPVVYPIIGGYGLRVSVESLVQTNSTGELEINLIYN